MSWFSNAWHSVSSGVSSAFHTVADPIASGVGAVQHAVTDGVGSARSGIRSAVSGAEDWVNRGTHALADRVSTVPVLDRVASGLADATTFAAQIPGGAINGITSLGSSVVNAVAHPLDTVNGLRRMGEMDVLTPMGYAARAARHGMNVVTGEESMGTALNETFNPARTIANAGRMADTMLNGQTLPSGRREGGLLDNYRRAIEEGRYGEIPGLLAVDVATLAAGGERAAGTAAEGARGVNVAAEGTRAAEGAQAVRAPLPAPPPVGLNGVARRAGSIPLSDVPRPIFPYEVRPPGTRTPLMPPEPPPQMPRYAPGSGAPPVVQHAPPLTPADLSDLIGHRSTAPMAPHQVPRPPAAAYPGARGSAVTQPAVRGSAATDPAVRGSAPTLPQE